jgi:hypothetical protein
VRLEPYRDAGVLNFLRVVVHLLEPDLELAVWREARASEDEFELYARWFGDAARGVRLGERNGIHPSSGFVNQERVFGALYGFDITLELETVDGVFEGSFATLRLEADAALEERVLEMFTQMFSRKT